METVFPYLDQLWMVLVMSVEPGFSGQAFKPEVLPKVKALRAECARKNLALHIQMDGGINRETAPLCIESGADVLVAGNAVFQSENPAAAVAELKKLS